MWWHLERNDSGDCVWLIEEDNRLYVWHDWQEELYGYKGGIEDFKSGKLDIFNLEKAKLIGVLNTNTNQWKSKVKLFPIGVANKLLELSTSFFEYKEEALDRLIQGFIKN